MIVVVYEVWFSSEVTTVKYTILGVKKDQKSMQ